MQFDDFAEKVLSAHGPQGNADEALVLADFFLEREQRRLAATALNRAFGLRPDDAQIVELRRDLLEQLSITEHGLRFRYVPAGSFVMGSDDGEADESPTHVVRLGDFWIAEVPMTWSAYCDLMGFEPPPAGMPPGEWSEDKWASCPDNRICLQYCETFTTRAEDWHAHHPDESYEEPDREQPNRPYAYDVKPVVAVSWRAATSLGQRLSSSEVAYGLPSEQQWEKAARGGLIGAPYSWGATPPDRELCDCDRFGELSIRPPLSLPPNGYGLYGMCGGVWEWAADVYDALAYLPDEQRPPIPKDSELLRVARGGSWADTAHVCTVSFRHARSGDRYDRTPNVGFRLCRVERLDDQKAA